MAGELGGVAVRGAVGAGPPCRPEAGLPLTAEGAAPPALFRARDRHPTGRRPIGAAGACRRLEPGRGSGAAAALFSLPDGRFRISTLAVASYRKLEDS